MSRCKPGKSLSHAAHSRCGAIRRPPATGLDPRPAINGTGNALGSSGFGFIQGRTPPVGLKNRFLRDFALLIRGKNQ